MLAIIFAVHQVQFTLLQFRP